jgi:hypothetical protein
MRRSSAVIAVGALLAGVAVGLAPARSEAAGSGPSVEPFCEQHRGVCPDNRKLQDYEGNYVGHDEPALLFYSNRPGSGNSNTWRLRLPHESPVPPTQNGSGGTWNFQRSITFWFGMALCESQSYPNPGLPCTPDSDANIEASPDRSDPDWVGNHVGAGYLELQFYPPGWAPFGSGGISCDAAQWCAAMGVFGLSDSLNRINNLDCLERAGEEWVNFAFITLDGAPQAPPSPLTATDATFTPDPAKALFMNPGDRLKVSIHDSPDGLVNTIEDLTTGQTGTMTASVANGFAHPLFQPDAAACTEEPYAFHPMYSTSSERTTVPWTTHSYNVAFSDEIGHFEYCAKSVDSVCVKGGPGHGRRDGDDIGCFNPADSLLAQVGGCTGTDRDFDGVSYQHVWSGSSPDPVTDRQLHAESFRVTSPLTGGRNYARMAFETDILVYIPLKTCGFFGEGCSLPPARADFYPFYSTRGSAGGPCAWQEGGPYIPGTTNAFGGSAASEYGLPALRYFPEIAGQFGESSFATNFYNPMPVNPCRSTDRLP